MPSIYLGEIVDINDPLKKGRARIRVFGVFDELPIEDIPWANQVNDASFGKGGNGILSVPKLGEVVNVEFDSDNYYRLVYYAQWSTAPDLLKEIENNYIGAHSLLYDEEAKNSLDNTGLKIFYTEGEGGKGLNIEYGGSKVNLRYDGSVYIETNSGKPGANIIHLNEGNISIGKEQESEQVAVLGDNNEKALESLSKRIDELTDMLIQFSAAQSAITAGLQVFAPLTPALTKLGTDAGTTKGKIAGITNQIIPTTKSKTISLGGNGDEKVNFPQV